MLPNVSQKTASHDFSRNNLVGWPMGVVHNRHIEAITCRSAFVFKTNHRRCISSPTAVFRVDFYSGLRLTRILREISYDEAQSDATVAVLILPCATICIYRLSSGKTPCGHLAHGSVPLVTLSSRNIRANGRYRPRKLELSPTPTSRPTHRCVSKTVNRAPNRHPGHRPHRPLANPPDRAHFAAEIWSKLTGSEAPAKRTGGHQEIL